MRFPGVEKKSVLITGCSSGIGAAAACFLAERGWQVIPTARKAEDIEELRRQGYEPVCLDLRNSASVQAAAEQALARCGGVLGGLVNNAGFGQPGAVEDLDRAALRSQFEVNVFGMQELTNLLLPRFLEQGWGRVVNVSSVMGRVSVPMVGGYCASKYAMEALTDALRVELRDTGVAVSLVEPGPILSAFRRNAATAAAGTLDAGHSRFGETYQREIARRRKQRKKADLFTRPPEAVAAKVLHALASPRPRRRYCVTIPAYAGAFIRRFVPPAVLDRLLAARLPDER
jgi:NAD(P)-dependent dehydrogenase (short-subunit alcohol dehydrogenase family)